MKRRRGQVDLEDKIFVESDKESGSEEGDNKVLCLEDDDEVRDEPQEINVKQVVIEIKMVMSYIGSSPGPFDYKKTVYNFKEWYRHWQLFIEHQSLNISPAIGHYHKRLVGHDFYKNSVKEMYWKSNKNELTRLCKVIDKYLRTQFYRMVDMKDYLLNGHIGTLSSYVTLIKRCESIEQMFPNEIKAAEAISYRRNLVNGTNQNAAIEHHRIYGDDWVVMIMARSVDVTMFDRETIARTFAEIEEKGWRRRYEVAKIHGMRVSGAQSTIEDQLRKFVMAKLRTPDWHGRSNPQNKRFKTRGNSSYPNARN
ncbi:hypothetical protein C7M61_000937 [Candidozyma pseudohaemuli]|uniref:Uncharacterized protein n=1 Tax=Candidozyma pseudohaemuli TaxID=418784 RepID=A0A2P7YZ83_9ASCO|nr:hypothetical protein C7M61_000937 [[Candida] pseudohaemulonii]PSK41260.1 hypothetical protein C7M61_000937 [[Candida] pseudohaemulonii]